MIIEIQCLPTPRGTDDNPYKHIEAAIALIQASGLRYEVEALGTTVEGEPEQIWPLLRRVHESCLESGAASLVSIVKIAQSAGAGSTISSLTGKFRA